MPAEAKSRMITFRLTEEEYERYRDYCAARGLESVSGMARTAINLFLNDPAKTLETRVMELEARVQILTEELYRRHHQPLAISAANRTV